MATNKNRNNSRYVKGTSTTPSTRVIVVMDGSGRLIDSQVVQYEGGGIADYYRRIDAIEQELGKKSKKNHSNCRVYTGTAASVGAFLHMFPEVTSPT